MNCHECDCPISRELSGYGAVLCQVCEAMLMVIMAKFYWKQRHADWMAEQEHKAQLIRGE